MKPDKDGIREKTVLLHIGTPKTGSTSISAAWPERTLIAASRRSAIPCGEMICFITIA